VGVKCPNFQGLTLQSPLTVSYYNYLQPIGGGKKKKPALTMWSLPSFIIKHMLAASLYSRPSSINLDRINANPKSKSG
jgi:hypothetical protein